MGHYEPRSLRKKKLCKLILAFTDFVAAERACKLFLENVDSFSHSLYTPLYHAIVVCYAKPFVENKGIGPLPTQWRRFDDKTFQDAHDKLLKARNELIVHNDLDVRSVCIIPPGINHSTDGKESVGIGFRLNSYYFQRHFFDGAYKMIFEQRTRIQKAMESEIITLYGLSQLPDKEFPLTFDEGL